MAELSSFARLSMVAANGTKRLAFVWFTFSQQLSQDLPFARRAELKWHALRLRLEPRAAETGGIGMMQVPLQLALCADPDRMLQGNLQSDSDACKPASSCSL